MKKIGICLGLLSLLTITACGKKEDKTTETIETTTNTVETDTVVKEVPTEKPEATSVKIDSSGVDLKGREVKVEVKK